MNRTLLDYLLNRVNESDSREFQRIVGADSNKLFDWLTNVLGPDEKKKKTLLEKATTILFGEPKSVFELSPEDLERLTRVTLTSKEIADFEITIQPRMLTAEGQKKDPKEMEYIVNKFYLDNELYFESPDDISFDPRDWTLVFKGRKRLAKKLLNLLGIEERYITETVDKKSTGIITLTIPIMDLVDEADEQFENIDKDVVKKLVNELKTIAKRKINISVLSENKVIAIEDEPIVDPKFRFEGHQMDIFNVLKESKLLDQSKVKNIFDNYSVLRGYMHG